MNHQARYHYLVYALALALSLLYWYYTFKGVYDFVVE